MKTRLTDWLEPRILGAIVAATSALWVFVELAEEVVEGDTKGLDRAILLAFRSPADPADPLGPRWLEEFARDVTGLGSVGVLTILILATLGFLLLARRARTALFVLLATGGGTLASTLLKWGFDRPRPELVPHGQYVYTSSFPSGHAMLSAVVYLTLGALVARLARDRRLKLYILALAVFLALIIGVSRVYLGVHWPSDVLAGWAAGAAWALACWGVAQALRVDRERREGDGKAAAAVAHRPTIETPSPPRGGGEGRGEVGE
ncbi:undecaprenyl-diphosphatase [Tistlia consotensis]|uniref:Undecaprenyl-diphosphatase n=1 Tax=Tistlia consotensis USBA 355 TaxID=560819 RepID=A0A1Y6CGD0_9PROT|nr:phosphatase PAP2 family protein [Tistlia consotensis]SMF54196.1 undecaprenyl-diphosphatase [Tistlia consotensis USBA 355]SNR86640.1 undecaprenyl-diphosphatase [Tistlia consotensis]